MSGVRVRRVYENPLDDDGHRVLVDRMWPRGMRRDEIPLDDWLWEIAPSTELRRWYGHEVSRFAEFRRRYRDELDSEARQAVLAALRQRAAQETVTLLTATRDVEHSHAVVLAETLGDGS